MNLSLPRLDLTQIFCDVDDFYQDFKAFSDRHTPRLPYDGTAKRYQSRLSISEVMTIVIAFHGSGYKTFKEFYTQTVLPDWRSAFPQLVSYNRFVELIAVFSRLRHLSGDQLRHPQQKNTGPQRSTDPYGVIPTNLMKLDAPDSFLSYLPQVREVSDSMAISSFRSIRCPPPLTSLT